MTDSQRYSLDPACRDILGLRRNCAQLDRAIQFCLDHDVFPVARALVPSSSSRSSCQNRIHAEYVRLGIDADSPKSVWIATESWYNVYLICRKCG